MLAIRGGYGSSDHRTVNEPGGGAWLAAILPCVLLGVAGPLVSLAIFRDAPDILVPLATVLFLLVPISALSYAALPHRITTASPRPPE